MRAPLRVLPIAVVPPIHRHAVAARAQDEEVVRHGDGGAAAVLEGGERGFDGGGDVGGGLLGGFRSCPLGGGACVRVKSAGLAFFFCDGII